MLLKSSFSSFDKIKYAKSNLHVHFVALYTEFLLEKFVLECLLICVPLVLLVPYYLGTTVANYATGEGNTLSKSAMKKGGAKKCLNCVESKCQDDEGCLIFLQPQISLQCQSLAHIHTYV